MDNDRRHRLLRTAGLDMEKLASIGAIAVLASHTEHYAERAIWAIEGVPVQGTRPWTDGKPISGLIDKLEELAKTVTKPGLQDLIKKWCRASRPCFSCRNSIFHGRTAYMDGEWTIFGRNERTDGVVRKRDPSDFHASQNTLNLLEEAFEYLMNGIHLIYVATGSPVAIGPAKEVSAGLGKAWSIGAELNDLAAAFHHEKY